MKQVSSHNTYFDSLGNPYSQSQINARITKAKGAKIEAMQEEFGFVFCEDCGRNSSSGQPIDCSHEVSVKDAKETRQTELCWAIPNIRMRCRTCHRKHDKTL